jgi:hypothetical protein
VDGAKIEGAGEECEDLPLLLTILDLSMWTHVFEYANSDKPEEREKALLRIKSFHAVLRDLLAQDFMEIDKAKANSVMAEEAIRKANFGGKAMAAPCGLSISMHKFLKNLNVRRAPLTTVEEFQDALTCSQQEAETAMLVATSRQPAVPYTTRRAVEDLVEPKDNNVWAIGNINLLAPIPPSTWRIWANLKQTEIKESREHAICGTWFIKNGTPLLHGFPLYLFDHTKCDMQTLKLHVKVCCPTRTDRHDKHPQEMWNIHRSYFRCTCSLQAIRTCNGDIIWFDHAVWYIINHLDKFFPQSHYPTLMSRFMAFMIWIAGSARLAVQCQLAFNQTREWFCEGVLQYAAHPHDDVVILPGYPEVGPCLIERHIKSSCFTIANPRHPSQGPLSKKQKINLNTPPNAAPSNGYGSYGRQKSSSRYGRGKFGGGQYGNNSGGGRDASGRGFRGNQYRNQQSPYPYRNQ